MNSAPRKLWLVMELANALRLTPGRCWLASRSSRERAFPLNSWSTSTGAWGWTTEQLLREYDHVTVEDLQACLAYAGDVLKSERVYPLPSAGAAANAMRMICNENISARVVQSLRDHGHDVLAVKESLRGATDDVILARAQTESRVVVTQDKDLGELAFRRGLPAQAGVILFRITSANPDTDKRRLVAVIESRADWSGLFVVVTDDRIPNSARSADKLGLVGFR